MYFKPCVKYENIIFVMNSVFIGLNVWQIQLRVQRFFRGRKWDGNEEVRTKTGKREMASRGLARGLSRGPSRSITNAIFGVYATRARGLGEA